MHPSSSVDRINNRFRPLKGFWRNEWWACLNISRKTRPIFSIRLHRDVSKMYALEIYFRYLRSH